MYLPLLIGLLVALAAQPAYLPEPQTVPILLLPPVAFLLIIALFGLVFWRRICHHCAIGDDSHALQRRTDLYARFYGPLIIVAYTVLVIFGHWSELLATFVDPEIWSLYRLLLIVPLIIAFCIRWTAGYLARRCQVNLANYRLGLDDLPPATRSLRDYAAYMGFYFRINILTLVVPFLLILLAHDIVFQFLGLPRTDFNFQIVLFAAIIAIYLGSPLLLRFAWKTRRIGNIDDALSRRLRAVTDRARVRVSGIFRWDTANLAGNACITGFGLPWRYVFISDLLLENMLPPQIEAVYGHEVGHARHHHLPVFLLAAIIILMVFLLLDQFIIHVSMAEWLSTSLQLLLIAAYWSLLLAVLSPFLERQSDLLGAASVHCPGHHDSYACPTHKPAQLANGSTEPTGGVTDLNHICPYQSWAFTSAMERLAELNGIPLHRRNIRHFSLQRRIDYIRAMTGQPQAVAQFHFRMKLLKLLMLSTALLLVLLLILVTYPT